MKRDHDSNLAALVVMFCGIYPFVLLGDTLGWPRGVQAAFAIAGLIVPIGVKLAVMRRERLRAQDDRHGARGGRRRASAAP